MTTESTNETPSSLTTAASSTNAVAGQAATRATMPPPPAERGRGRQVLIRLNHAEHEALGVVARQHGQSVASYVRGLLYGSVGFSQAVNERMN